MYINMKSLREALVHKYMDMGSKSLVTGSIIFVDRKFPRDPKGLENVWMYLSNRDARKRIKEFDRNIKLTDTILSGANIIVCPETSQNMFGYYGVREDVIDLEHNMCNGDNICKIIYNPPINMNSSRWKNKTLRNIYIENNWFQDLK